MLFKRKDKQRMRRTLEKRWFRNFLQESVLVRWFIVLLALGGLVALCMVPGRLEPIDLTVGQLSPRTIVARVHFSYKDDDATEQEKDRRAKLIPYVYRLSTNAFQRDLTRIRHLMDRIPTPKPGTKISENKLRQIADIWNEGGDIPLTPADVQALAQIPNRKVFLDTLEKLGNRLVIAGIISDELSSQPEMPISLVSNSLDLSQIQTTKAGRFLSATQAKRRLMQELNSELTLPKQALKPVEAIVMELVAPNVQLDLSLREQLQEQQRRSVGPLYRDIAKGDILVERGERLTQEKLYLLKEHEKRLRGEFTTQTRWRQYLGTAVLVLIIVGGAVLTLLFNSSPEQITTNREYGLLATLLLLHLVICRVIIHIADHYTTLSPPVIPFALPFCFGSMLAAILLQKKHAHVVAFVCSFLIGIITQFNFSIILTSLISSIVGIHFLSSIRSRGRIYEAGLLAGLAAALVSTAFGFISEVPWKIIAFQGIAAIISVFAASLLISALLPLFEWTFKITTDLRWLELADLNHPLLRRMVMEAPGTYHHSLVVANLAERACQAIGAHALQARVCSYFHDIGKLNKPEYFCENQGEGDNPHHEITPTMSALIIISHVKDGVDLAIQHRLARPILDTIQQHHGTSQVTYFYRLAKRNEEDAKLGSKIMKMKVSDVPRVEEETYRYPGPKPGTREIGVISLADAVEGASRCLLKPTPQKVEALVNEIIDEKYRDGQLDECPLSLRDLKIVAESFSKTILSMIHTRVSYPKDEPDTPQSPSLSSAAVQ